MIRCTVLWGLRGVAGLVEGGFEGGVFLLVALQGKVHPNYVRGYDSEHGAKRREIRTNLCGIATCVIYRHARVGQCGIARDGVTRIDWSAADCFSR